MKKLIFNALLSCLFVGQLAAQKNIEGLVIGSDNEPLLNATVVLLSEQDSSIVSFTLSNGDGEFKIDKVAEGDYLLQITFLGYQQYSKTISTTTYSGNIDLETIQLSQNASQLDQIEIKGEHVPIQIKKDTVEYNAAAFQTQPNEVVEDLLKKLPGVEVESDGTVIAQGEEVQQVLVDGKRFFGDDPKIATKNLPADAVDKVQIFDQKSDMAEFSGVDDGEREKTINLELKEDRKKGQFGNIEVGYGTDERYKGRFSLNRFAQRMQLSTIGNFNNINEQGFSSSDYINFIQGMGGGRGRANAAGLSLNNGLSDGFVTTNAGGINLNYDFSEKVELSASYFLNNITNDLTSIIQREEFLNNGSFLDDNFSTQDNSSTNHRFQTEWEIELDSTQDIRLRTGLTRNVGQVSSVASTQRSDFEGDVVNSSDQELGSDGDNLNYNGNFTYRKKFGSVKKRILSLSAGLNELNSDTDGDLSSDNQFFEDQNFAFAEALVQNQIQNNDQTNYNIQASFVEPIKAGQFLELKYRRQNFNTDLVYDVFDAINGVQEFNEELSNAYARNYYYDRMALAWHLNTDQSALTIEGAFQNSNLNGLLILDNSTITNNVKAFLPRLSWRYQGEGSSRIRLQYNTSVNEPSMEQLQPLVDNSDPLNISVGNPDLVPEYRHNLRFNYMNFDQFSFRSFFAFINASYVANNIENQTVVDRNFVRTTQPVNVSHNLSLSSNLNYSAPWKALDIRYSIRGRLAYSNGVTFLNGQETTRNRYNGNLTARIENRDKEVFDWVLGGSYGYNITNYDLEGSRSQSFFNPSLFTDLRWNYKKSFSVATNLDVNFFSEEDFGESQTVPILKASISKFILKNQRAELKLSVFDIFNRNLGVSRINGSNYVENREITSLGRFFMLSCIYSIKAFGGNNSGGSGSRRGRSFRPR